MEYDIDGSSRGQQMTHFIAYLSVFLIGQVEDMYEVNSKGNRRSTCPGVQSKRNELLHGTQVPAYENRFPRTAEGDACISIT